MSVPIVEDVNLTPVYSRDSKLIMWNAPIPGLKGFNVYRSLKSDGSNIEGPLNGATLITISQFEDTDWTQKAEFPVYYYFVTAMDQEDNESELSFPVYTEFEGRGPFDPSPSNPNGVRCPSGVYSIGKMAEEWKRRSNIILGFDGEEVYYLIRKTAGEFSEGYDPAREEVDPRYNGIGEENGYDTIYKGGYVAIKVIMRVIPARRTLVRGELGLDIDTGPSIWCVDYPVMTARDVVVRRNNERYRVVGVRRRVMQGLTTRQDADIRLLEPNDVVYTFPLPN